VASNFGYIPADPEFLQGIRDLTRDMGILLIFDEVQSFRLSSGGAQEHLGVTPDITTFGKIIGGGMPVGAWGGRRDLMALFDPSQGPVISHSGTFNANPMTMVAGEATLEQLTPQVYRRMNSLGDVLREKLRAVFAELEVPAQVTGIGSLFSIHFTSEPVRDYRSMARGDQNMKAALFIGLLNERVLVQSRAAGALNALTTMAEVDALVAAVGAVTQRIRG
jgi:glutamate-1-semialdehyde 2,1-aminomutase